MDAMTIKKHDQQYALSEKSRKYIFIAAMLLCASTWLSAPEALLLGLILAQLIENPFTRLNQEAINLLLKISVVGLGFGMNFFSAMQAGRQGIALTAASIVTVLTLGMLAGRYLKVERKTSFLIAAGTAICGGSAIAALSPVIGAQQKQISVALGVIFVLNSIALFVFPFIGHNLHLSQTQFGIWCAVAIHDTSSVVGAASRYGTSALQVATTVKLVRALWIIPVAFFTAFLLKTERRQIKIPYFIGLFILAMALSTCLPVIKPIVPYVTAISKTGLTLTLFLIGSGLSLRVLKSVGIVPLLQGILLWVLISATSLWAVCALIKR